MRARKISLGFRNVAFLLYSEHAVFDSSRSSLYFHPSSDGSASCLPVANIASEYEYSRWADDSPFVLDTLARVSPFASYVHRRIMARNERNNLKSHFATVCSFIPSSLLYMNFTLGCYLWDTQVHVDRLIGNSLLRGVNYLSISLCVSNQYKRAGETRVYSSLLTPVNSTEIERELDINQRSVNRDPLPIIRTPLLQLPYLT